MDEELFFSVIYIVFRSISGCSGGVTGVLDVCSCFSFRRYFIQVIIFITISVKGYLNVTFSWYQICTSCRTGMRSLSMNGLIICYFRVRK